MYKNRSISQTFILLFISGVFFLCPLPVFAIIYQQGETLDPACLPTDADCTVATTTVSFYTFFSATTTDALAQGSSNKYYSTNLFAGSLAGTTTTALAEGSNLYFTAARGNNNFATNLGATTTSALVEGSNLYFTNARVDSRFVTDLVATTSIDSITTLSNLIATGALTAGSIGSGFGNINIGANTFTGNGSGLTALNATNLTNFGTPFYSFFSATTTDALTQGFTNKYYSTNLFAASLAGTTTSALAEGANLYFTNARADARINATSTIGTLTSAPALTSVSTGLTGLLKATAGALTTTFINLVSDVSGILPVGNGGTGWANIASGAIPYGNGSSALATTSAGTAGRVLAYLNGIPTWTATTTFSGGLSYSAGNVTLNSGNANTWSALQQFSNASSTLFSAYGPAYFGATATSSFSAAGALTLSSALTVPSGGTGATSFGQGWLFSSGDGNALSASTSPTVNYITATSTTATSTFANGINITAGCFAKNGICLGAGSDLQYVTSYKPNDTFTNIPTGGATTTLTTISITPSTATGDVLVRAGLTFTSSNATDQPFAIAIHQTDCTGTILQTTLFTIAAAVGAEYYHLDLNYVAVDPGASSQTYAFCVSVVSGAGDTDVIDWNMSAIVIDTGADVAEVYTTNDASLEAGDVVSLDPNLKTGVRKTANIYDKNVLGIVSTRPGSIIGGVDKEGVKALPVALTGRVLVKVNTENGVIAAGDYLTPSSVPGVAMKSSGLGPIIGQALWAYNGDGISLVMAFVKNFDLGVNAALMGDVSSSSTALADIQSETPHNPITILAEKIAGGIHFLTDFVVARVTGIRGYFDEVFAKKVHTDELCLKKKDGTEVCINGDQTEPLLGARHDILTATPQPVPAAIPEQGLTTPDEHAEGTSTPQTEATKTTAEEDPPSMSVPDPSPLPEPTPEAPAP